MSNFDDAWESSVDAEHAEMGEWAYIKESLDAVDFKKVRGTKSDMVSDHVQSTGGKRDLASFRLFVKAADAEGVKKGFIVEVDNVIGRVLRVKDLDKAGSEIVCGPVSSWGGKVPGV
jgi:hypothetical protein